MTLLREPLLYFLIAGSLMFLLPGFMAGDTSHRIVVTDADQARLANQWQARMGRSPTAEELDLVVDQWIRGEIYFREAVDLGLHENDPLIRRRLVEKLRFLEETGAVGEPPDEAELRAYYEAHSERYTAPVRYTFRHRFFDHARPNAELDARRALESQPDGKAPEGDPFPVQDTDVVERWSERDVAQLFGSEFAEALRTLETGVWQGPVRSGFGWHLIQVERKHPADRRPFEEVKAQVLGDYQQDRTREQSEAYFQALREKYRVVRP